jgi:anaerobic magnesium-protoporphyrin IX monomethyl ester cyclase
LCRSILRGEEPPEIDGLVRLDAFGSLNRSPRRLAENPRWTELPFPARELIDLEPYRKAWIKAHGSFSTNMVSSRGCPYHCNWCAKPISGNKFHLRSAAQVAEEMRQLKTRFGAEHIWFGDDIFALDHAWVAQFASEVIRRDARIPFKIQTRANLMSEHVVQHLASAGCSEVWMGVESGSQDVLDAMDKGLNLGSVREARGRLRQAGIRACFFLQFGYPGERWAELQETIEFVRETRPDDVGISFSYPLPGTVFYQRVIEQLGDKRNWTDSDDLCIMYTGAYKTDFYRAVRDALHAEVDSWAKPRQARQSMNNVDVLWRRVFEMEPISRDTSSKESANAKPSLSSTKIVPIDQLVAAKGF